MAKLPYIEFSKNEKIPILFEDRTVLAVDKPRGWMLVPFTWQQTDRNLQAAILSSIAEGHFWARSRNLKYLRYIHRLDGDTTGVLLFAKSKGALDVFSTLFEERRMQKTYLAVSDGVPKSPEWTCKHPIAEDPQEHGVMRVHPSGKHAETHFKTLCTKQGDYGEISLIEARPVTGRTHQIRVHLAESGLPISGDPLYAGHRLKGRRVDPACPFPIGLRAIGLAFTNPLTRKPIRIVAPHEAFIRFFGFGGFEMKPPQG